MLLNVGFRSKRFMVFLLTGTLKVLFGHRSLPVNSLMVTELLWLWSSYCITEGVCLCVSLSECVSKEVYVCVCVCVRERECVCVCVRGGGRQSPAPSVSGGHISIGLVMM